MTVKISGPREAIIRKHHLESILSAFEADIAKAIDGLTVLNDRLAAQVKELKAELETERRLRLSMRGGRK